MSKGRDIMVGDAFESNSPKGKRRFGEAQGEPQLGMEVGRLGITVRSAGKKAEGDCKILRV